MAWLRGSAYLTCFYCGTRSQTKNDGFTRQFLCRSCDAVNYLDENGDITDPPVANDREDVAPTTRYASPAVQTSTDPEPTDDIFCSTCLKNQRLFAASLAQYLPDDPSHPEYQELERNYYRYRKTLEERYPQVCEECAARVDSRIRQAGYLAKTDHLRRMMERTRGRKPTRRTTTLDWASRVGGWLWWAGLALQMLWHFVHVATSLDQSPDGMRDPDDEGASKRLLAVVETLVALLPSAETLIQWSITAAVLSIWWNPHFVQVNRGFTRHLLGLTQWYSFQGLIVFFRLVFRVAMRSENTGGQTTNALLGAHAVMAGLMVLIYSIAGRSIRVDTTPLFASTEVSVSPKRSRKATRDKTEQIDSVSDQLRGLATQTSRPQSRPSTSMNGNVVQPRQPEIRQPRTTLNRQSPMGSLSLADSMPPAQPVAYPEEMDWSPTPEQPRAFSNFPSSGATGSAFGAKPAQTKGAFWHKVPPAPVNPAQRLRNPTKIAPASLQPAKEDNVFFAPQERSRQEGRAVVDNENDMVSFKQPSFFAPEKGSEEANSLADLLSQSFSIHEDSAPHNEEPQTRPTHKAQVTAPTPMIARAITLAVLLAVWLLVCFIPVPYSSEAQLVIMGLAGTIALQITGDTSRSTKHTTTLGAEAYMTSALGAAELAAVCWVGWETWRGYLDVRLYGMGVLVTMLGHQVWNTIR